MTTINRRTFATTLIAGAALAAVSAPAFAASHTVKIKGFAFEPANLTIKAGDTVTFVNEDGAPHTATGDGFDTGRLGKGQSAAIKFNSAGSVDYFCAVHPMMKGKIAVN